MEDNLTIQKKINQKMDLHAALFAPIKAGMLKMTRNFRTRPLINNKNSANLQFLFRKTLTQITAPITTETGAAFAAKQPELSS